MEETPQNYFQEESPKQEILQGALEEFLEHGKQGARMQSIADRAGVNKALLHYYFSSKDNLHQEVIQRVLSKVFVTITGNLDPSLSPTEQIRVLLGAYFQFIRTNPELPRLILMEMASGSSTLIPAMMQVLRGGEWDVPDQLIKIINRGIEQGEFRQIDPKQFIISFIGMILFYFIARPVFIPILGIEDEDRYLSERLDHLEQLILHGLIKE